MKLPQDYSEIVANGTRALQVLEVRLRIHAEQHRKLPELWLSIRDISGLHLRLEGVDEWEWRTGYARLFITVQDVGVLDELVSNAEGHSAATVGSTPDERVSISQLREFIGRYVNGEFEFDDPATLSLPSAFGR